MKEQKDRYEIFLKVCETGSFSGAAEALNYTQSGISQMMAGLEEELEVRLFARVKKRSHTYRQRSQTDSLYSGNGKPEGKAAPGGL